MGRPDPKPLGLTIKIGHGRKPLKSKNKNKTKLSGKGSGSGRGRGRKRNNSTGPKATVSRNGVVVERTPVFSDWSHLQAYLRSKYHILGDRKINSKNTTEL